MAIFRPSSMYIGDGSGKLWWILAYQGLDVKQKVFAGKNLTSLNVIWMKRSSSGVTCFRSTRSWMVSSKHGLSETIDYSISSCLTNIKMNSIIIIVDNSLHANHSTTFVSYTTFNKWLFLLMCFPSDLVNTIYLATTSHTYRFNKFKGVAGFVYLKSAYT